MNPTPRDIATVIGQPPPGVGDGHVIRIGPPLFERGAQGGWDIMRETLWVSSLNRAEIAEGADRAKTSGLTGDVWRATTCRQIGIKAGKPVVELISKGWMATKDEFWTWRRQAGADSNNALRSGNVYAARTYFSTTVPTGNYTMIVAPAAAGRWGFGSTLFGPSYADTWPYYLTGTISGWVLANREPDVLGGSTICRCVDTYMWNLPYDAP